MNVSADDEVLDRRRLNRALLARQHLLERTSDRSVTELVEHLVGLQAQAVMPPFLGCWARLEGFDPEDVGRLLAERRLVRLTLMRGTVHLVTVRDAWALRSLVQVVAERGHSGVFGRRMGSAEPAAIERAVREILADGEPRTARELARLLIDRGMGHDVEAIANAVRVHVALVQVPPRGSWGASGQAKYLPLEDWTGHTCAPQPSIDEVVLRYLAAFGPATVMDAQNWSGLTRLKVVFERLRPRLETFRDERGKRLYDLPDAPRPDADVPAPVRLLGEFDNVLLGHADRRRIVPEGFPWGRLREKGFTHNLLVDGMLAGAWWLEREGRKAATLVLRPAWELDPRQRADVEAEACRTLDAMAAGVGARAVRIEPPVQAGS